jgi:hypothetical protein
MRGGSLKGAHRSMKAWVPVDPAESSARQPGTRRGVLEKFLRWLAEIGWPVNTVTKHFFRPKHPASRFTAEQRAEGGAEEEIQRRRDLVRMLFNDFWSEAHDKPTAFIERLYQAEDYCERATNGMRRVLAARRRNTATGLAHER